MRLTSSHFVAQCAAVGRPGSSAASASHSSRGSTCRMSVASPVGSRQPPGSTTMWRADGYRCRYCTSGFDVGIAPTRTTTSGAKRIAQTARQARDRRRQGGIVLRSTYDEPARSARQRTAERRHQVLTGCEPRVSDLDLGLCHIPVQGCEARHGYERFAEWPVDVHRTGWLSRGRADRPRGDRAHQAKLLGAELGLGQVEEPPGVLAIQPQLIDRLGCAVVA